jgi:hypothetical protein
MCDKLSDDPVVFIFIAYNGWVRMAGILPSRISGFRHRVVKVFPLQGGAAAATNQQRTPVKVLQHRSKPLT